MRITQNMMLREFTRRSGAQLERVNDANMRLATGERILKPSDDPSGLARIFRYESMVTRIERYSVNTDIAKIWLETTQGSINQSSDLLQGALNKAMIAISDTTTSEANDGLAQAVRGYIDELMSLSNRTENGRYIFSGTRTSDSPFERLERDADVVGSLPSGVDALTVATPYSDLPELERGVYTIEITSDGVDATISMKNIDGTSVQFDDNNKDETYIYSSFNHMANDVTVSLGTTVNTGRGVRIETSATMASGTQSLRFTFTPEGSFEYMGNAGAVKAKIGDGVVTDLNVAGHLFLQADTVIGTRVIDAINGTPVPDGAGDMVFMISDGLNTSTITLSEGVSYTQDEILQVLDEAGLFIGEDDQHADTVFIKANFDDQGHLRFRPASENVPSKIVLNDIGSGTNTLRSYFGLATGQTDGVAALDTMNRLARNIEAGVLSSKIFLPTEWSGDSKASASMEGVYTGSHDATWIFTVGGTGGLIGQTEGLTITVTDAVDGSVIKTIDVGDAYASGAVLHVGDGVDFSLTGLPGRLQAGDSFTLDLRCDRSNIQALSDMITQQIKEEAAVGSTLQYMTVVTNKLLDYQTLLKGQLESQKGISITEAVAKMQQEENAYNKSLAIGARILQQRTLMDYL
ncbi:hypothetical protein J7M28_13075 [bacterium]|nr:hypothetical protein [bacterium]